MHPVCVWAGGEPQQQRAAAGTTLRLARLLLGPVQRGAPGWPGIPNRCAVCGGGVQVLLYRFALAAGCCLAFDSRGFLGMYMLGDVCCERRAME